MRISIFLLLLVVSCGPYRHLGKNYITLSESACVDGTILNIDQAGCEAFYWGTDPDGQLLKIRCAHSEKQNWWTQNSFYAVPHSRRDLIHTNWRLHCEDTYVKMFVDAPNMKLEVDD